MRGLAGRIARVRHPEQAVTPVVLALVLAAAVPELPMLVLPAHASTPVGGTYHAVTPVRILDTRVGTGGFSSPITAGHSIDLPVGGVGPVPASGVAAAVLNVTVTDTTAASFLTIFPTGVAMPVASNLNWVAGVTVPNLVTVGLGTGGKVTIYNGFGSTDVVVDVEGYYSTPDQSPGPDGLFNPLVPLRLLDTRIGTGAPTAKVLAGATLTLHVTGVGGTAGVPASGAAAVVLNVTVTNPTAASFLTVWPSGVAMPLASNLNFRAGQTVPNRVMVGLGTGGSVSIYNGFGTVDIVADVNGWFTDSTNPGASGSRFTPVTPARILDSRIGTGGFTMPWGPNSGWPLAVAGQGGVPLMSDPNPPTAVVANVTVTDTTAPSALTAWPDGAGLPLSSDLNWVGGLTVPNLDVIQVGPSGNIDLENYSGCTDVIVDVVGWFTGPAPSITAAPPPLNSPCPISGKGWLSRLNYWRAISGLPPVTESTAIGPGSATWSQGDYNHAVYMVKAQDVCHCENSSSPYYTVSGNYASQNSNIEVSSTTAQTDDQAIDWWMGAPFHAMAMVDPRLQTAGYGAFRANGYGTWASGFAINVASGNSGATGMYSAPIYFPGNGKTVPLRTYSGGEFPDPLSACGYSGSAGLPVFVEIGGNVATNVSASSFKGNGSPLAFCVIDSAHDASFASYTTWRGAAIVVPKAPLAPGVNYTVSLTINGQVYAWSFQVS
jgi:hypothetical protein